MIVDKLINVDGKWRRIPLNEFHPNMRPAREINVIHECSTCRSMTFSGVHLVTQKSGWCKRHHTYYSGRFVCESWCGRSSERRIPRQEKIESKLKSVPIRK